MRICCQLHGRRRCGPAVPLNRRVLYTCAQRQAQSITEGSVGVLGQRQSFWGCVGRAEKEKVCAEARERPVEAK